MKIQRFSVDGGKKTMIPDDGGAFCFFEEASSTTVAITGHLVHLINAINKAGINAGLIQEPTTDVILLSAICKDLEEMAISQVGNVAEP